MQLSVFLAVLAAAVMHAGWNVLVKLKLDRFLSLCLIQTLMGFMGVAMLLGRNSIGPDFLVHPTKTNVISAKKPKTS